ncbi:MAG: hypothetical protein FWF22_05285 [Treponema sp.]|nr:hypothetical protein [Treponema sp.]
MKRTGILFPMLLILLLAAGNVFASGGGQQTTSQNAQSVKQSITFTGYPMNAKDQTITWFASQGYQLNSAYSSPDQSPFHTILQDMLGVKIDWIFPIPGTPGTQAINLVLASGDLPDVMYGGLNADAARYINEGTFCDLTPYMANWSPAYWKFIHTNPAYDRAMKTDAGQYYGYGFFREDGSFPDTYQGPVVNKTWLDECNLPLPATIADWDNTLRVFKQKYGAVLSAAWARVSSGDYPSFIAGAFGAYAFANYRLFVDNNGKIQLANIQPDYKTFLMKMNEWWSQGLIDQDILSINDTMARSNALNLKTGLTYTSMGQMSSWIADATAAKNGANWIGLQYPKGNDGRLVTIDGGYGIGNSVAVITTSCKPEKMELVMRAMDYAYTDDGSLYWNFGKQGNSWDYGPDGKPMFLPLVTNDPNGLNNAVDKYAGSVWDGNCIQATQQLKLKNTQQSWDAMNLWYWPNQDISAKNKMPPGMTLNPDEATRAAELRASISTFVDESVAKFMTGQVDFSTWDSYVAQVNSMGLAELLRIEQAAYDRYTSR